MKKRDLKDELADVDVNNIMNDINLQTKTLKLLLTPEESKFREEILDVIQIDFFESNHHKLILKYAIKYLTKYDRVPDINTMKQVIASSFNDKAQIASLNEAIDAVYGYKVIDKEFVVDTTLDFFRKQSLKKSLFKVADHLEKSDFNEIFNSRINKGFKTYIKANKVLKHKQIYTQFFK